MFFQSTANSKKGSDALTNEAKSIKTEQYVYTADGNSPVTSLGKRSPSCIASEKDNLAWKILPRDDISAEVFKEKNKNKISHVFYKDTMNIKKLKIGFNGLNYQQKSGNQSNLLGFKNLASASKTINSNATLDKSANSTIIDQKEDYNRLSSPEHTQKINLLGIFSSDKRDGSKTFVKDF